MEIKDFDEFLNKTNSFFHYVWFDKQTRNRLMTGLDAINVIENKFYQW
jgi:hypothetical protein